jgi:hypothetical protein
VKNARFRRQLWYLPDVRHPLLYLFLSGLLVYAWTPSSAFAYEDQATLGVDLGYAARLADQGPYHGAVFSAQSSLGLNDIWSIRARLAYAIHPDSRPLHLFFTSADIIYLVDILQIVPFFGGGIDGIGTLRDKEFTIDGGIHAVLGVDYLWSRDFVTGIEVRPLVFISRFETHPAYFTVNTTASLIFDL